MSAFELHFRLAHGHFNSRIRDRCFYLDVRSYSYYRSLLNTRGKILPMTSSEAKPRTDIPFPELYIIFVGYLISSAYEMPRNTDSTSIELPDTASTTVLLGDQPPDFRAKEPADDLLAFYFSLISTDIRNER